jgi:hypothetical protein
MTEMLAAIERLRSTCRLGDGAEVTLAGRFVEHVDHREHHLGEMLARWEGGVA